MKKLIFPFLFALTFACSIPPGVQDGENNLNQPPSSKRPQTIFEGVWKWMKTEGVGIAGPYVQDSTATGYSVTYDFLDGTQLQTYTNVDKDRLFEYRFTLPITNPDGTVTLGILTLEDKQSAKPLPDRYYWDIQIKDDQPYLYLKNTEPCCDNSFTQIFKLVAWHTLSGSK